MRGPVPAREPSVVDAAVESKGKDGVSESRKEGKDRIEGGERQKREREEENKARCNVSGRKG